MEVLITADELESLTFYSFVKQGSVCIVNAASERDVAVFAAGMIQVTSAVVYLYIFMSS